MNIRGVGSTVLALALVLGVAACDDNPISDARDVGEYFMVNPTNATVDAGDTTSVIAIVMNRYGTPTNDPVTAEPCDSKVTAMVDPERTEFESPETFLVIGNTVGLSCIVVRGGGLVDSATVRVVPASLAISGDTLISSGEQAQFAFTALNASGQAVAGLDPATITFISRDTTKGVIDATGAFSARAPGQDTIIVSTNAFGVARADTIVVRVQAGAFNGTFTPANPLEGSVMQINAGTLQFDTDTQVLVDGVAWPWVLSRTATTLTLATPPTGNVVIGSIGANQVALNATIPVVSAEPDDDDLTTPRVLAETDSMWFSMGGSDVLDLAKLVVPTGGGTYRFTLDWAPNAPARDLDIVFFNSAGAFMGYGAPYGGCATGARPEGCTVPLAAGTWYPAVNLYSGDPTTAKLTITRQ